MFTGWSLTISRQLMALGSNIQVSLLRMADNMRGQSCPAAPAMSVTRVWEWTMDGGALQHSHQRSHKLPAEDWRIHGLSRKCCQFPAELSTRLSRRADFRDR